MNYMRIIGRASPFLVEDQTEIKGRPAKHVRSGEDSFSLFRRLLTAWREETMFSSSDKIFESENFKAIVGMGNVAVPLIISEIKREPDLIVHALPLITGQNPVVYSNQGNLIDTTTAWAEWYSRRRR